jgi:hypothetical protein
MQNMKSCSSLATFLNISRLFMMDVETLWLGGRDDDLSHSKFTIYGFSLLVFLISFSLSTLVILG